jgi:GH35 family endo-1,4-beta-xylanase
MISARCHRAIFAAAISALASSVFAQDTTLNASALAFRSGGTVAGTDITLSQNGYLGTYVTLAAPGTVNFGVNASGTADGGVAPRLNLAIDDYKQSFSVAAGASAYNGSVALPAGTHFVRLEYDNDSSAAAARTLNFKSLSVSGATVANAATNANALAAANTYIDNYRKGTAHIALTGPGNVPLLEGTQVRAKMARNAFYFGGTVSGASLGDAKNMLNVANPSATSEAGKFQAFVKKNFNTIVPSNGGKWAYTESTQNSPNMALPDQQLNWAIANNKRARMHTLIWGTGTTGGNQEPAWVQMLIASAAGGNATAKTNLRTAISNRIKYYAGTIGNRSQKYIEIDGLNESLHNPAYTNIFGTAGVADIYNELSSAITAAGGTSRSYLNEWNVLQYSPASVTTAGAGVGSDAYANYYRSHIDAVRDAGGNVSGVGIQYYANYTQTGANAHSAATIQKALGNLSGSGLPISMAEFGGATGMTAANSAAGATVLDETLRMFYGTPNATTFMIWGWWDLSGAAYPPAALLNNSNGNLTLTPMGEKWEELMAAWSTDVTNAVGANGVLDVTGFYGDYNINNVAAFSNLTLTKGTTDYALQLATPPSWSLFNPNGITGVWTAATAWSSGGVPNGAGVTAHFVPSPGARTVSLDANVVLGQINFDGAGAYKISSGLSAVGAITLQAISGEAALNVVAGSHEITVPLTLASDTCAVIREAGSTLILRSLADSPTQSLVKRGLGTFAVDHIRLASLSIEAGKVSVLPPTSSPRVNVINTLAIAPGASLDLNDSIWAIDGEGSLDDAAAVKALIRSGGISSAILAGDSRRAIGWADASSVPATVLAEADLDVHAIVFRATWQGDSNLDGGVDFQDLVTLAQNYDDTLDGRTWAQGDATGDGRVNFGDLVVLAQNYGLGTTGNLTGSLTAIGRSDSFAADWALAQSLAPEPGVMFATLSLSAVSGRRCRR